MKSVFASLIFVAITAQAKVTYFSCVVKEPVGKKTAEVIVKFAVKDLDMIKEKGELIQYPGSNEEWGLISVTPQEHSNKRYSLMSNLNGQGGDLRIEGTQLRLWGDGAGYQFTDLVIWDVSQSEDGEVLDAYVRDYGPTYGKAETFKQFIKCQRSGKKL